LKLYLKYFNNFRISKIENLDTELLFKVWRDEIMVFNLTHSQIILRYKENGRWSEPYYSNHGCNCETLTTNVILF
jgi:hypothetical protein